LKQEYAALAAEKKALYADYHRLKDSSRELSVARDNTERILGIKDAKIATIHVLTIIAIRVKNRLRSSRSSGTK